jgi:hypothetical protein
VGSRVARWFIFKPKIPIWVNFGSPWNRKCCHILQPFGIHLHTSIWYNLWPFGIVCGNLVYFFSFGLFGPRKIWQPWWEGGGAGSANPSAIPPPQPPFIQLFFSITLLTGMTANSLLMGMTSVFSVTQAFFSLGTIQSAHHMANTTSCCFL